MKKYFFLLLLPVAIYFYWSSRLEKISRNSESYSIPTKTTPVKQLIQGKRTRIHTDSSAVSDVCEQVGVQLDDIDFNLPFKDWLEALSLPKLGECENAEYQQRIALIQEKCLIKKSVSKDECMTNLVMLRSLIRAKKIKDPTSRDELADMIMAEFSKKDPDFKKLKNFSRELLNKDPGDKPVQKVWAMSAVISGDPKNIDPALAEEIYETLDPEQMNTDPELRGLDVILKTGLKPASVEVYSRDILAQNPKDLSSREMLGWSLWQQGRREEAIAQVDAILALNPKDQWLKEMRRRLTDPKASKDSYAGRLNLGIRLEDLWD